MTVSGWVKRAVGLAFCAFPFSVAWGQADQVVCAEIAPYCFVENGEPKGFVYEVGKEILKRLRQGDRIEFQPLARSIHSVQRGSKTISLWLGRIPEREGTVRWIAPIFNDAFHIYTLKGRPDATSLEKARALKVLAATIAGANIVAARGQNLGYIDPVASEEINGKKLLGGRVDGWISARSVIASFVIKHHLDSSQLVRGIKLADYNAFIVASVDVDAETLDEWKRIHGALVREGFIAKVMKKYRISEM